MDWLLLRGLARETGHWGKFIEALAIARPGDRFHTLDLPGMGSRCHETSPTTIPAIRRQVQLRSGFLNEPFLLVGLSLGGMVALDWASEDSTPIAGVVAINSSCAWNPPWQRLQANRWLEVLKLLGTADAQSRETRILDLTSNRSHPNALLAYWQHLQAERPVSRTNAFRQILAASRYRPRSEKPSTPVLLLASEADRLVSYHCSETLARRWQCPLQKHNWAGHDLPLDDPQWVIGKLVAFQRDEAMPLPFSGPNGDSYLS
jgi:pimeloyl-[acyl-carrier protein] methyl ester esterase